jgi:hypothetical protein
VNEYGYLLADEMQTSMPGAGGDIRGAATVILAMGDGKGSARHRLPNASGRRSAPETPAGGASAVERRPPRLILPRSRARRRAMPQIAPPLHVQGR